MEQPPEAIADEIISLYQQYGAADYIGEPVSQIEHMCQCAQLAEADGYEDAVILAAFFHDIGHFCERLLPAQEMNGFGVVDHEKLGSSFLRDKGFSEKITLLVENHVQAKRWLTYSDPGYYQQLSEASKNTLAFQGGIMTEAEAALFEAAPLFPFYVKMRQWDEKAKATNQPLPPLEKYRDKIIAHLKGNI